MNRNALKAKIVENGMTQKSLAERIGMSSASFWRKMKNGNFGLQEANAMIEVLHIENPGEIFFGKN